MKNNLIKAFALVVIVIFTVWLGFFVGIDLALKTLVIVMAIDYLTGVALALMGNSKHGDGSLSSKIGYKGLVKKVTILLLVGLCAIIEDYLIGYGISFQYLKDISIIAFIINEIISIMENAKLAGLEIPDIFTKLVDFLKSLKIKK